jgi:hypothetical protein
MASTEIYTIDTVGECTEFPDCPATAFTDFPCRRIKFDQEFIDALFENDFVASLNWVYSIHARGDHTYIDAEKIGVNGKFTWRLDSNNLGVWPD